MLCDRQFSDHITPPFFSCLVLCWLGTAEAAQIVLDAPIPKVMIPLNVTHKAIVTDSLHTNLINPTPTTYGAPSGSRLRHMLSTLISFFRETYKSTFGFLDGPPLHDVLTIAYV